MRTTAQLTFDLQFYALMLHGVEDANERIRMHAKINDLRDELLVRERITESEEGRE